MILALPSNESRLDYPGNKPHTFRTKLLHNVNIQGVAEYQVGLSEIHFSTRMCNVRKCWLKIRCGSEYRLGEGADEFKQPLEDGFYPDIDKLIDTMRTILSIITDKVTIHLNRVSMRVTFELENEMVLELSKNLARLLGFGALTTIRNESTVPTKIHGAVPYNIFKDLEYIYVNSDISDWIAFGSTRAPLLRVVNTGISSEPKQTCIIFPQIDYVPLVRKHFDTVMIWIRLANGEAVPFMDDETTIAVLKIRRKPSRT